MLKLIATLFAIFFCVTYATLSPQVIPSEYKFNATFLDGKYFLFWNIIGGDTLDIGIICNCSGWVNQILITS